MSSLSGRSQGIVLALAAAALFGASAPLSKWMLPASGPWILSALLYLGAGLGAWIVELALRGSLPQEAPLSRADGWLLAGVVLLGGMAGPWLLLTGLGRVSGLVGALLLNLEAPLTILVAIALFREHLSFREGLGALAILAGAAILGLAPGELRADWRGSAAIALACLAWAVDNNLTQRLSSKNPVALVRLKGLAAGGLSLSLALSFGRELPGPVEVAGALAVGAVSFGLSMALAVYAMRRLGAALEAALFSTAPFFGAALAVPLFGDRLGWREGAASVAMVAGVFVLAQSRHGHLHTHEAVEHEHRHSHDDGHHSHLHPEGTSPVPHSHSHRHPKLVHDHAHTPDEHHRHRHA